ncbi:MAG: tetratricopeptide repeat protein [Bacteroidota bacterium]
MHKKSFLLLLTIFLWGGMPPTLQAQQTREAVLDSAQALHRLGDSSLQGGNWDRSVDYYHQASRLYHRLRDEHRFLLEHLYLALAFQQAGQMGNYTRYKKELTPYLQSQDTLLAQVLLSMGTAHHHADAHQEAKKYLEQALTHVQTYGPHQQSLAALIQVSLGQISREAGELELAASTLNALVHAIRSDSLSLSLEQQVRIAHLAYLVHRDQQQLSKALADARWAKEMYGRMSLEQQAKWNQVIWGDLVEVFTRLDMPDSSLHYARQQWTFTSPQSYNWSATLVQLARLQIKAQQETEAEKNLQLALGQWQQLHPGPHLRKAEIYALQGYTKAKQNEALDAAIAFQKALIAGVKGFNSEDMADYPAAETFPPLGPMLPVIWAKAEALLEYAAQTKLADHYQAALAGFELAHQLEDKLDHFGGKYGFEETWQAEARSRYAQAVACADHLHQLTGQESYARAAFLLAQQGKSRIRQAQLVRLYDRPAGDALAVARQRLGYLQEELYTLDLQISAGWDSSRLVQRELQRSALLDQIAYEQRQIKRRYPSFYDHFKGPTALDVKDFRQKLSEGEMVLQYFLAEETLYCFGLTQDEFWVDKKAWATETSGALRSFLLEVSQED